MKCPNCHAPVRKMDGFYEPPEAPKCRRAHAPHAVTEALRALADAAETFASSDPEMPSHAETEAEFERALAAARKVLG